MKQSVAGNLNITDRIMNDTFWIGVYPGMSDEMIDKMLEMIREWMMTDVALF